MVAQPFHEDSSYGPIALSIFQALESYGVDAAAIMQKHGIDIGRLKDPAARLDTVLHRNIVADATELTKDPAFGLRCSDFVHPTTFHAFGIALLSSCTLRSFCIRWVRYYSFIITTGEASLVESESESAIVFPSQMPNAESEVSRVLVDGQIATALKLIRSMYRPDYCPTRVELVGPAIAGSEKIYERYLGPNIYFSQDRNAIYFSQDDLDVCLPAAISGLARQYDEDVVKFLARLDKTNIIARTNSRIIELLPSGDCSKATVANSLFMSVRTLHNRLADAGTTYQALLDQARRGLAENYILQDKLTVGEIAYQLGFSGAGSFSRAFHCWTGQSPSTFCGEGISE